MDKKEIMFSLISRYESSGLSQALFCKEEGIGLPKFSYWRKKWIEQTVVNESSDFIQIIPVSEKQVSHVEIKYPNGVLLSLNEVNVMLIKELVHHV